MVVSRHKAEIFNLVIISHMIYVMNNFAAVQMPTNFALHDKDMFHYIPVLCGVWMIWNIDFYVTITRCFFSWPPNS